MKPVVKKQSLFPEMKADVKETLRNVKVLKLLQKGIYVVALALLLILCLVQVIKINQKVINGSIIKIGFESNIA